ncbi:hypothetical protein [Neptunitalea lumnitzerae]|uniref:Uncharacterized protein n=1 Tax=Neptunitalea lumnitzerae TaxID=2965509 RepID=A0ABQ5MGE6_9FLAO|nr:hypothetical protein [Neptunitalea sp. Y10]GLB47982.1 hypothetical protein Y10_03500 [Neptunitalea sp. Y10]
MAIIKSESGVNLANWTVVLGDGNYAAPGVAPVSAADIATSNTTAYGLLEANVDNRRIMAHNITYNKIVETTALSVTHTATYTFKIPYTISTGNTNFNGQTVEGGLFVWDGVSTQLDYGLAFQWVINPWDANYGKVFYWNGSGWTYLGCTLTPDTNNHEISFELNIANQEAYITLDGVTYTQNVFSETTKSGWGTTVDARFQAETISIYPSATGSVPSQKVEFKNWSWVWDSPSVV